MQNEITAELMQDTHEYIIIFGYDMDAADDLMKLWRIQLRCSTAGAAVDV